MALVNNNNIERQREHAPGDERRSCSRSLSRTRSAGVGALTLGAGPPLRPSPLPPLTVLVGGGGALARASGSDAALVGAGATSCEIDRRRFSLFDTSAGDDVDVGAAGADDVATVLSFVPLTLADTASGGAGARCCGR